jgi:arylsulfatase A-like enzyme
MGLHGNPLDLTPNLDRAAIAGTHVANSFTCQPVCGPARSCLQTGMYASQTGCYQNGIPLDPSLKTLAYYFTEAGYQTGYIGKWHLARGGDGERVPKDQRGGYDYWLGANAFCTHRIMPATSRRAIRSTSDLATKQLSASLRC